jgi:NADH-quinone oxidoreductase subunit G
LTESLKKLDLLIVLDYLPTLSAERAHVLLPTATLFETESLWINHEGRLQKTSAVHGGGVPIHQVSGGSHPPRVFESHIPGGEVKPAAAALADLEALLSLHEDASYEADIRSWLAKENPLFKDIASLSAGGPGIRVVPDTAADGRFSDQGKQALPGVARVEDGFDLLLVDWTFGTEELSGFSPYTQRAESQPHLMMHQEEASRLGLSDGHKVILHLPGGPLEVEVKTAGNMSSAVVVMPRHRRLDWQKARAFNLRLPTSKIERI